MNQRKLSGSISTSAIAPSGSTIAPAIETGATSRQLHCGIACRAKGRLQMLSINSSVGAATVGPYTAEISGI